MRRTWLVRFALHGSWTLGCSDSCSPSNSTCHPSYVHVRTLRVRRGARGGGKLRSVLVVRCGCRQMWTLVALTTVVVCSGADNDAARLVASGGNAVVNEKVVTAVLLI